MRTYFFYDLETSGLNPRDDRIMQFAGIRTDEQFNPIGEPYNLLVALNEDTLPNPGALMVTGITPQQTVTDGYTEAEFARIFVHEVCTPETVIIGFNNIRFDDEFMRALLWRNYYDPYEWCYKEGRSRWDLLDVVRLTRALRPEGINWPVVNGVAVNKLELLSRENGLEHAKAHDALSDVEALIAVTKLIATTHPQLYEYLFKLRDKNAVKELVQPHVPFVYASGRYASEHNKTTVAMAIASADFGNMFVYDLRHDPTQWVTKSQSELEAIINTPYDQRDEQYQKVPVKKIQFNRAPAVAPVGVLEGADGWNKLGLTVDTVQTHRRILLENPDFAKKVAAILAKRPDFAPLPDAESKLYDGFVRDMDKMRAETVRNASREDMKNFSAPQFDDVRLREMYARYKARNYMQLLSPEERTEYELYRNERLERQVPAFTKDLQTLASKGDLTDHQMYVLEELKLWFESVMPVED